MGLPAQALDRLREYLAQLPAKSQALLMREFERAVETGQDVAVATVVLDLLRQVARAASDNERPRGEESSRLVFRPLEPFLVDSKAALRPGQIRRGSLSQIWNWLKAEGAATEIAELDQVNGRAAAGAVEQAVRKVQIATATAIEQSAAAAKGGDSRALSRIGGPQVVEDLMAVAVVLKNREPLEAFGTRIAGSVRNLADSQLISVQQAMNVPSLQTQQALPFTLSLLIQKLAAPWQVIRLAIAVAGSDDEIRVAATNYGVAVTMVIHDLSELVADLRTELRAGRLESLSHRLKIIHDALRGMRTELDIRAESAWGKRLSAIRVDISNILRSELEGVPGKVRRLLRQRPDKDITPTSRLDSAEIDETAALIDFVAVCRTYASELAINEVTLRTYSDLQQYVETSTQALVDTLRACDQKTRPFRQMQAEAAIRFCDVLFGHDYAALMRKAADVAISGAERAAAERKTAARGG
jgi:hypothetical protein